MILFPETAGIFYFIYKTNSVKQNENRSHYVGVIRITCSNFRHYLRIKFSEMILKKAKRKLPHTMVTKKRRTVQKITSTPKLFYKLKGKT